MFGRLSLESIRKNEGDRMLEELAKDRKYLQVIGIFFLWMPVGLIKRKQFSKLLVAESARQVG